MTRIPTAVSDYLRKIGRKGGQNGRGIKKQRAGSLGGKKSGEVRRRKALDKLKQAD